ncbi:PEP-CTERM sorting domain-containing protein [Paucibacter sp. DJ2R-2]|uniref:PEP-CTERM sorting domain-containing protein n=1 Tax=Paucibacter sp. DJ2R-2 TaxID=2893558 RepID=UPI0021E4F67C|nr:PEP-CTERM sorting domain-containing protein [Paucibacter sp. DJ2R-2]MCV2423015.1 PEP-CTERM sorting domain-containing protein [Paucibacter sp. DJ4R-1]MCV2440911.1 PEP-CTERM sorting domain-containing protein [Paucibacter sp. DJ2R-2]
MKNVVSALGVVLSLVAGTAGAVGVPGQGTWQTSLQSRDLDHDGVTDAFYDKELNITWLRNANVNGAMEWASAKSWAEGLTIGGVSGWRLPAMVDTGTAGCNWSLTGGTDCGFNVQTKAGNVTYSELAHLWYETLGNKGQYAPGTGAPQPYGLTNTGDFQNLQASIYWTGTEFAPYQATHAWYFSTLAGWQDGDFGKQTSLYAIAVRDGDVVAVPEPSTYALMLAGLFAVGVLARRRKSA